VQAAPRPVTPQSFTVLASKADAAKEANRLDDALLLYRKALALRPGWAEGWWSLGTIAYDRNSYPEAARAFQKVVRLAPRNGTADVMLGLSEFELGRDDPALRHIEKGAALGLDSDPELRHVALYHEAVLLQRQGRFESARDILQQLCLQGVQSDEVSTGLGMTLLRLRRRNAPSQGSAEAGIVARVGHAGCLTGQKKFDDARREMNEVVAQNPKYSRVHYAFGLLLVQASELPAAVAEFKEEIRNDPSDVISRLQIAAATYKTDSAAGLPYAEEAVRLAPQQSFAHYLLGMLLLDTDNYQRAIPELEIARKAFPHETRIYLALGTAYSRAGRKQDAASARATFLRLTAERRKLKPDNAAGPGAGDVPTLPE
jgi:tetratricopeptide (TPR) repeat protein